MVIEKYVGDDWEFNFIMRCPEKAEDGLPLIVQLHGAGERGDNEESLSLVECHGFANVIKEEDDYKCILVEPQCPNNTFWVADIVTIKKFIDHVIREFRVNKKRVYLTGLSMGGFGTWYTSMAYPNMFAAIAPVCGGGMSWYSDKLDMPIWAFHGVLDTTVDVNNSIEMIKKIMGTNKNAKLTLYDNVGHNSWEKAYSKELLDWLLSFENED